MFLVPVTRHSQELSRNLDRLFDDTFERFFSGSPASDSEGTRSPAIDVAESEQAYTVLLDVPGVTKDQVQVSIEGRRVTVQAQSQPAEEKKQGDRVLYRERAVSSYARSFTLPAEVDQAEAQARLEHGVLTLTLPKRAARNAARITVN